MNDPGSVDTAVGSAATGRARYGGTRLAGRRYFLGRRPVEVICGWGPGATVRNVRLRFLDTDEQAIRPFRGLRLAPTGSRRDNEPERGKG